MSTVENRQETLPVNVGDYVYARDSMRISGSVEEVFHAEWEPNCASGCRTLTKLPATRSGPALLCAIRLSRPINVIEGFAPLPSGFVTVIEDGSDAYTDLVYGPADRLVAMPNSI